MTRHAGKPKEAVSRTVTEHGRCESCPILFILFERRKMNDWDFWVLEDIASHFLAGVAGCGIGVFGTIFFQWVF